MSLGLMGMKDSLAKQITPFSPIVGLKVAGIFTKAKNFDWWSAFLGILTMFIILKWL